ncbi:MAG: hypothetical protein H6698_08775 [Myxococcales bacterium]|nr:hypothetical protein [Myxococcales bacterium]MCB9534378.1 hypothetical protein [Myxococcales bacterium]
MKTSTRSSSVVAIAATAALTAFVACGDDDHDHDDDHDLSADCAAIVEACHTVDDGSGDEHYCHLSAHENIEAECATQRASCVAICEALQ